MARFLTSALIPLSLMLQLPGHSIAQRFTDATMALPLYLNLSEPCIAAMNSTIECPSLVSFVAREQGPLNEEQLGRLCKTKCYDSLVSVKEHIDGECTAETDVYPRGGGKADPATWVLDHFIYAFNFTCLKDPDSGDYCSTVHEASLNGASTEQRGECSNCTLDIMSIKLNSPFGYHEQEAKKFESMTSSCNAPGYTITPPKPYTFDYAYGPNNSAPMSKARLSCDDQYFIRDGDTCTSIALANNISTLGLTYKNDISAYCDKLYAGPSICLPGECNIHEVKETKPCTAVVGEIGGITKEQLWTWNPKLGNCESVKIQKGTVLCISPPGGGPVPIASTTSRPTSSRTSIDTGPTETCLQYPAPSSCFVNKSNFPMATINAAKLPNGYFENTFKEMVMEDAMEMVSKGSASERASTSAPASDARMMK